jgi:hypothetical protein
MDMSVGRINMTCPLLTSKALVFPNFYIEKAMARGHTGLNPAFGTIKKAGG